MKRILFTAPCRAELVDVPVPEVGDGQVLVKLAVSTISSGTERANLVGEINVSFRIEDCKEVHFPRLVGYSSSGTVIKVGSRVTSVRPGDRVALSWSNHSQYCVLEEKNVIRLDDSVSFEEAAMWHIGTFPMAAVRKCRVEVGESAIVMGQGILGRFAVRFLHAAGAVPILAADPVESKRKQALEFGADYAFDPYDPDFTQKVKEVTHGGVHVAIEVTGIGQALDQVLDCMAPMGRVALLGCTRKSDFAIDFYHKVHGPGISLIGAHTMARPAEESSASLWTQRDDIFTEMNLSRFRDLNLADMVEETHSPVEAPEVFRRLAEEPAFPLVQFDWRQMKE